MAIFVPLGTPSFGKGIVTDCPAIWLKLASAVSPARYLITSQMRYNLATAADAVYFSVIQFDEAGNQVGYDEVRGNAGDNYWTWIPKVLRIGTTSNTTSIRIRFGLVSSTETYLDVDAVR